MSKRSGPNKKNLEETRDIFIQHGLAEFIEHGYANASTTRIVEATGMARGSLYYHFADKQGLFRAVFEYVIEKAAVEMSAAAGGASDTIEALSRICDAYLDLCATDEFRKIILIESQAVLDFHYRMAVHKRTIREIVEKILKELVAQGKIRIDQVSGIGFFLYGTCSEMGRFLDDSADIEADKEHYKRMFAGLLQKVLA